MAASMIGFIIFNLLFLVLFFFIAILYVIFNTSGRNVLARKVLSIPYIILGILGAIFFAETAAVSNLVDMAVPFVILYIVMIMIGIYVFRWKPTGEKPSIA